MSSNLDTVITFSEACQAFEDEILPLVAAQYEQDEIPDYPARCEEWCNWTDELCKDGQISDWQYENWSHPDCNYAPWEYRSERP